MAVINKKGDKYYPLFKITYLTKITLSTYDKCFNELIITNLNTP